MFFKVFSKKKGFEGPYIIKNIKKENKKGEIWENIQQFFFKTFLKKKVFEGPYIIKKIKKEKFKKIFSSFSLNHFPKKRDLKDPI